MKTGLVFAFVGLGATAVCAEQIGPERLIELQAEIVILGEVHDNSAHHANQALAVALLRPSAIVFEMLTPEQAERATPAARSSEGGLAAVLRWEEAGWPDFADYYPIFTAHPDATIRGAAMERDVLRRAFYEGAAAVFGPDAERFGLAQPLSPQAQAALEAEQMQAHCNALPAEMMAGMVEAQRLQDAAFARATLEALHETGGPVVLITGSGHARTDTGVPAVLRMAAPEVSVISLGQLEAPADPGQPFDYWIVSDPAPRSDPCAVFR